MIGHGRAQADFIGPEHLAAAAQALRFPARFHPVIARQHGLEALAQMFRRRYGPVIQATRPVRRLTGHILDHAGQQRAGGIEHLALGARFARAQPHPLPPDRPAILGDHGPARGGIEMAMGHRAPVRALQRRQAGIDLLEIVRVHGGAGFALRPRRRSRETEKDPPHRPFHGVSFSDSGE